MLRTHKTIITVVALTAVVALGSLIAYAQMAPQQGGRGHGALIQMVARYLNLTPEQREKAKAIHEDARSQMLQVLTPSQQHAWHAREQRMGGRIAAFHGMVQSLGLSADQRTQLKRIVRHAFGQGRTIHEDAGLSQADRQAKMRALRQTTIHQLMQVLTPAQRKTAQAYVCQGFRGEHGQGIRPQLTPEQRTQIKAIREKALADFRATLTPEQQQQLDQFISTHHHKAPVQGDEHGVH